MTTFPSTNTASDWPLYLFDQAGQVFILVRQGVPPPRTGAPGDTVLYSPPAEPLPRRPDAIGLIDNRPLLLRRELFQPAAGFHSRTGGTFRRMTTGGPWMSEAECVQQGIPVITPPDGWTWAPA